MRKGVQTIQLKRVDSLLERFGCKNKQRVLRTYAVYSYCNGACALGKRKRPKMQNEGVMGGDVQ